MNFLNTWAPETEGLAGSPGFREGMVDTTFLSAHARVAGFIGKS